MPRHQRQSLKFEAAIVFDAPFASARTTASSPFPDHRAQARPVVGRQYPQML